MALRIHALSYGSADLCRQELAQADVGCMIVLQCCAYRLYPSSKIVWQYQVL